MSDSTTSEICALFQKHPDWYKLLLNYIRSNPMFFRTPDWGMTYATKIFGQEMPVTEQSDGYREKLEACVFAVVNGLHAGIGEKPNGELEDHFEVEYVNGCSEPVYLPNTFPRTHGLKVISNMMAMKSQRPEPIFTTYFHTFLFRCLKADLQVIDGVSLLYRFWVDFYVYARKQQNSFLVNHYRNNIIFVLKYFGKPNGETYNTSIEYFREKPTPDRFYDVVHNLFIFVAVFKYTRRPDRHGGELTKFTKIDSATA